MASGQTTNFNFRYPLGTDALDVHGDMSELASDVDDALYELYNHFTDLVFSSGAGDVVGPAGATDNAVVRFDLASGNLIQDSGVLVDDSNNVTIPGTASISGATTVTNNITLDKSASATTASLSINSDTSQYASIDFQMEGTDYWKVRSAGSNLIFVNQNTSNNTLKLNYSTDLVETVADLTVGDDLVVNGTSNNIASNSGSLRALEIGGTRIKRNQTDAAYNMFEVENGNSDTLFEVMANGDTIVYNTLFTTAVVRNIVDTSCVYPMTGSDHIVNCTSGTFDVTLPSPSAGRECVVKNSGSGTITVQPNGAELIDGDASKDLAQYSSKTFVSDGTDWIVI